MYITIDFFSKNVLLNYNSSKNDTYLIYLFVNNYISMIPHSTIPNFKNIYINYFKL